MASTKDTLYTALHHICSVTAGAKGLAIIANLKANSFPPNKKAEKTKTFRFHERKSKDARKQGSSF